jgi:adenine-specific DNA-methyltransferase
MKKENVTKEIKLTDNIEILKKYFPSCFDKRGNFNIEKFKEEIKKEINVSKESYGLEWLGKSYARVLTFDAARTLLREDEEWNKKEENFNSENLLIKGDNLEVLKHIVNAYEEKVKMIYIDPPYNTGNDGFVYQDDRKFSVKELAELAGIDEEKAKRILEFVNSKSNSHSAWLTFMYPRLYIARRFLKEDGVIFVSIDDNEVAQLRLLMDEIFGEENFVGQINVINNLKGRSDDNFFATCNEYLLVYARNIRELKIKGFLLTDEEIENEYKYEDEFGKFKLTGFRKTGKGWQRENRPYMYYPILEKDGLFYSITKEEYNQIFDKKIREFNDEYIENLIEKYKNLGFNVFLPLDKKGRKGRWRWGFEEYKKRLRSIALNSNNTPSVKERPFLEDGSIRNKLAKTTWYKGEYDTGSAGKYLRKLFSLDNEIFENPKSVIFLKDVLSISTDSNDIILDFFAGSGTTGDAVMQLNAEDGGNRKFILVQLPEEIDEKKNKAAYDFFKNELKIENPTVFNITKERLVRATKKIKEEYKDKELDLGFKIFETIPIWEDYLADEKELSENTTLFDENKLSEEDIKALFITWKTYDGIELSKNYEKIKINDYIAYYTEENLYLMHKSWKSENVKTLLEKIDKEENFVVKKLILFGYNFTSKHLREIEENIKNYANKKEIEIETVIRF